MYEDLQFQTILTVGAPPPLDPSTGMVAIDPTHESAVCRQPRRLRGAPERRGDGHDLRPRRGHRLQRCPWGFEADLHALFMDARFPEGTYVNDDRLGLGTAPAQVDIGGNWLPRVSPFTFNYSLSQLIFTDAGSFDWIIQGQTRGQHFFTAFNGDGTSSRIARPGWGINPITGDDQRRSRADTGPVYRSRPEHLQRNTRRSRTTSQRLDDRQPTYTMFNLGLGWRKPDGMISVRVFVNNVFNIIYA